MKVTVLGSGTSHGIPVLGCDCAVCTSLDPRNKRTRCSVWVESETTSLIIDTPPDFRMQGLREGLHDVHGIFYTHAHADHLHGLDDIRPFCWTKRIPVYGNLPTIEEIRERFSYIFRETQRGGGKPKIELLHMNGPVTLGDITVIPVPIKHGKLDVLGFRIGNFAYLTDCSGIPEESYGLLRDLDVLIIGALRYRDHETHFSVSRALVEVEKIRPRQAYFTHLCHRLDHETLDGETPDNVSPAWDGLTLFPT